MNDVQNFQRSLERSLLIHRWNPTTTEIIRIARLFARSESKDQGHLISLVTEVCPSTIFMINEGGDNSDLRTLVAMAIQVAKSNR